MNLMLFYTLSTA